MSTCITHDPNARLDYAWDWTAWLTDGETITSHTITVTTGDVTVESSSVIGGAVVAWVTGGTVPTDAKVTCHITTSAGRQDDRTRTLMVRDR